MEKYEVDAHLKKNIWESFLLSRAPKTFLQSWNWGDVNKSCGSKIFRFGYKKSGKLIGVCLLIKEEAKRGPHLVIPAGPIIDWEDKNLVKIFLKSVKDLALKENVWFIRMRPEILETPKNRTLMKGLGFISAPMHLHAENTWILDISKSEDEILSQMRKSTRYLIRKSQNEELKIEISNDPKYSKLLYELQKETALRHKFVGFGEDLFKSEIEIFGKDNEAKVFICRQGKRELAAAIIIFYGDTAYYHFSGSISEMQKIPFSYFLQWEVIKYAKKVGIRYYNFWGIAPDNNPRHRFAGVTLFKTGFGGERVDWLHAHDLPVSKKYILTYAFETLRRIFRRL